ncbi:MAG: transposase [Proteobacteria bacterium]|nr:transposase [Pseudomonadota bacterium]
MGHTSKMGDRYLRRLLVNGMMSRLRWLRLRPDAQPWAAGLLRRKPPKLVAVAMANKTARIADLPPPADKWAPFYQGGRGMSD